MKSFSKFLFFSVSFLCVAIAGVGQSTQVNYSYDANGNRVLRWVTILKIAEVDSSDSIHQDSLANTKKFDLEKFHKTISIFPNPTIGLLELKINGIEEGELAEYVFVSLSGQELIRKKTGIPFTQIDISSFAPGTYIVNVTLGEKKEVWKIIKH